MIYFIVICLIELQLLPYAHEAVPLEDLSLANKQLRFVSRFLMVCLLLNRREMVHQLLNQLRVLVDERKRTFQVCDLPLFCY